MSERPGATTLRSSSLNFYDLVKQSVEEAL